MTEYEFEINPDFEFPERTICEVHREVYRIARDRIAEKCPEEAKCLIELMREAFDMGKRMDKKLKAYKKGKA